MTLTAIILLIAIGIIFLLLEILVVPGVGFVGIIGAVLMIIGIYYAYRLNTTTGHITLLTSSLASVGMAVLALRSSTWNRAMLKSNIEGKVSGFQKDTIQKDDEGITISRLNPIGKVKINGNIVEARSKGDFIDENIVVKVAKVDGNVITVQPKTETNA